MESTTGDAGSSIWDEEQGTIYGQETQSGFEEKTNEHVIVIEYRVRVKGTVKSTPRKNSGRRQLAFLRQLMTTQAKIR
jgi:hypothetical protein